ncbi:hypothetical protein ACJJTC_012083 [Scirpophaga incertulas]
MTALYSQFQVLTFFVAATLLLLYVAKKGMLRVGGTRKTPLLPQHEQPKILVPVEMMPLKNAKDERMRGRLRKRWIECVNSDMRVKEVDDELTSDRGEWKRKTCCADPT